MKLLIVDDIATNLELLRAQLEAHGHDISEAGDGIDALNILHNRPIDAVVSDILMPRMDGYRLCLEVRKNQRLNHLPFVLYSSTYTSPSDESLAIEVGADAFVQKPAPVKTILEKVNSALERTRPSCTGHRGSMDEFGLMKEYNERLVSKLEAKNAELERINVQLTLQAAALETAADAVSITGASGEIIWVNPAFSTLTGYSRSEVVGKNPRILRSGQHDSAFYSDLWQTILSGKTWHGQLTNRRKDGTLFFGEQTITPVRNGAGATTHFVGIMKDVTARHQAEKALRESEEKYRDLFDNANDLIQTVAPDGRLLYVNKAWREALGYNVDDATHLKISEIVAPELRDKVQECINGILSGKPAHLVELEFLTKDGKRIAVEGSVSAKIVDGRADSIRCIFRDITEKKKLEAQFLRNQRMESLGTLAGGIAHDLNNVLAPILMCLELLKMKFPDAESGDILGTLASSAQRGSTMVKQVLTFARGFEGKLIEVQLQPLLKEIRNIITQTFPKNIRVKLEFAKDLWAINGDATQLHQVILNLCVNARDAMPHGGALNIAAENVSLDESFTSMNPEAKPGRYVLLSVADSGTGMTPEVREKIFDPFFTTKPIGQGTGLGLSTARGIIKTHGGFVLAFSEVGKGSIFKVYIPALIVEHKASEQKNLTNLPQGNGELILVVDDEASVRTITQQTLEMFGYRVLTATDGAHAVAACAQNLGKISLMITDLMMPIMDGPATIRATRSLDPKLKIITTTGLPGESGGVDTDHYREYTLLQKPYTAEVLLKTIREVLTGQAPIRAPI